MLPAKVLLTGRAVSASISIIDIQGEFNAFAERALLDAYSQAASPSTRVLLLNCGELEYMNSGGIGLLISFLIQFRRQQQRLLAYGLSAHYRYLLELTRLNEIIGLYDTKAEALHAAHTLSSEGSQQVALKTLPSRLSQGFSPLLSMCIKIGTPRQPG